MVRNKLLTIVHRKEVYRVEGMEDVVMWLNRISCSSYILHISLTVQVYAWHQKCPKTMLIRTMHTHSQWCRMFSWCCTCALLFHFNANLGVQTREICWWVPSILTKYIIRTTYRWTGSFDSYVLIKNYANVSNWNSTRWNKLHSMLGRYVYYPQQKQQQH